MQTITEKDILNYGTKSEGLHAEDIVLRKFNINMGMKDKHPLEAVRFYRTDQVGNYQLVKKELTDISLLMPDQAQSCVMRLFVKDESKFQLAANAFEQFCKEKLGGKPQQRYLSHSQSSGS